MKRLQLERATATVSETSPAHEADARSGSYLGVPGLDALLSEGLGHDSQIMVTGDTGVGKTVLAAQFLYEGLLVGDRCIYIACDEAPSRMRQNMANLRLGTVAYERAGRLVLIDAFARQRSTERIAIPNPGDLDEYFAHERAAIDRFTGSPVRLVVDSLSTIFGTLDRATILDFNRHRLRLLSSRGVLALDNYVMGLLDDATVAGLSHAYPLIVKLAFQEANGVLQRYLQIGKLRSGMFSGERIAFRIDPRTGIVALK
jgi:KaiC/GvpD/RAD55 family RecA-like ATPase